MMPVRELTEQEGVYVKPTVTCDSGFSTRFSTGLAWIIYSDTKLRDFASVSSPALLAHVPRQTRRLANKNQIIAWSGANWSKSFL
jgi:hypothetical protein